MIDTHCHLDYCADPHEAAKADLKAMVSIGTNVERSKETLSLADRYEHVWAAIGIHPNNASDAKHASTRAEIESLATHKKVVAIGETGFDNYWDDETLKDQAESFLWQVGLASRLDKALILHIRDKQNQDEASRKAMTMLKEANYAKGILHCFNGHLGLLELGLELGWMVSFAGNVTYKKAIELHQAAKLVPQDRLLVETDSPFLAPVPKRGKKNTPEFVKHTAAFLADLRNESYEELECYTDANAMRIYGLEAQP